MKRVFISFLILITTVPLIAQTTTVSDEIVVTASAVPETVESTPAAVTVITKSEIEERAARDVGDVLREVPGVIMSRAGSPGRATSLFTRGGNSTHTLVLWNGIEITNPYFAGYDWGRFSTAGVSQVEVVRGPYSALYGSDAVSGVVNVLTMPAGNDLRATLELGGHGLRNGNVAGAWVSQTTTVQVIAEKRDDDGFAPNDDFSQDAVNALLRWKPVSTLSIGVSARHTNYDLGIPTNLNALGTEIVPSLHRRQTGSERQIAIPIEQTLGNFSYELTLAESRRDDDFTDPDDPYGLVDSSTESTTRRARLTTHTKLSIGTLVAGGEWERARVDDINNFGANLSGDKRSEHSFFVEDRFAHELAPASRVEVSAGVRYDNFDTFGSQTSPRVAAAWIAGLSKVRVAYGEAFRAPAIGELYFPFSGNRNLEPERSRSFELGYDRVVGSGQLSLTAFRGDYRQLIVFDNATFTFQNVGRARTQGLEVGLQHDLAKNVYSSLSYSYLDTTERATDRPLLRRPRHSGSLLVGWHGGNADVNATLLHAGRRDDVLPVAPFSRTSARAYTTLDLVGQYHYGKVIPFVKLENVTNERYEEVLGYPSPSRRAVVGLRYAM